MSQDRKLDERFARTFFVVQADSFAISYLMDQFSRYSNYARHDPEGWPRYDWKPDGPDVMVTIGEFHGYPVNIKCRWETIGGKLILFYRPCSVVSNDDMVGRWFADHCHPTWGGRPARCNAWNFHHCREAIDESTKLTEIERSG